MFDDVQEQIHKLHDLFQAFCVDEDTSFATRRVSQSQIFKLLTSLGRVYTDEQTVRINAEIDHLTRNEVSQEGHGVVCVYLT